MNCPALTLQGGGRDVVQAIVINNINAVLSLLHSTPQPVLGIDRITEANRPPEIFQINGTARK